MYENREDDVFYHVEPMESGGFAHVLKLGDHEIILLYRRKNYKPYDETPTIKDRIMNPQTTRKLLKIAVSLVSIVAYGAIHKADKTLSQKIDEHYSEPTDESEDNQNV